MFQALLLRSSTVLGLCGQVTRIFQFLFFSFSHSTFWFILGWSCWQAMISATIVGKRQTTVTEIIGWSEAEEVIREKEEW